MVSKDKQASAMPEMQVAVLEPTAPTIGNPRLRDMGVLEVRRRLKKEFIGDPAAKAAWDAYDAEWHDRERTYAAASVRGFERGERGGWV